MPISILIPVDRYPWSIDSVLHNLDMTEVPLGCIDVVFVTGEKPLAPVRKRLEKGGDFRWYRCPLNVKNNHLPLLDYAFHHDADLGSWVVVQHADTYHRESGWLQNLAARIKPGIAAIQAPRGPRYKLGGRFLQVQHDYLGCFNRQFFIDEGLTFSWGKVNELPVSPELLAKIDAGKIRGVDRDTWLDGSVLLGLELSLRHPEKVRSYLWHRHLHLWQFYKWGNRIRRDGDKVIIRGRPQRHESLIYYSAITSFYFSRHDPACLPYSLIAASQGDWTLREFENLKFLLWGLGSWHRNRCEWDDSCGLSLEWTGEDDAIRFADE